MPVIVVLGVPKDCFAGKLRDLRAYLQDVTAPCLCVKRDQVSVLFPADMLTDFREDEVIAFIYLHEKPERTPRTLEVLREAVGKALGEYFPTALVECCTVSSPPATWWSSED